MSKDTKEIIKALEKISISQKVKPFIKWVGGKTKLIQTIVPMIPKEINNYYELFIGGGSVLLSVLSSNIKITEKIYAYDINKDLIDVYKNIQNNPSQIINYLDTLLKEYNLINGSDIVRKHKDDSQKLSSKESYYYWLRNKYNSIKDNTIEKSSLFLFLNKTCYRGLYRVGPNGFNVPYGHYKTVNIDKDNIYNVSNLIKDVIFIHSDFSQAIGNIKSGDFLYLDPPYYPKKTDSFVNYTKEGFSQEQHTNLINMCNIFSSADIKFLLSNSDTKYINDNFDNYKKIKISVNREINAKNPGLKTGELLITNY